MESLVHENKSFAEIFNISFSLLWPSCWKRKLAFFPNVAMFVLLNVPLLLVYVEGYTIRQKTILFCLYKQCDFICGWVCVCMCEKH